MFGLDREHDDSPLEVSNFQPFPGFTELEVGESSLIYVSLKEKQPSKL